MYIQILEVKNGLTIRKVLEPWDIPHGTTPESVYDYPPDTRRPDIYVSSDVEEALGIVRQLLDPGIVNRLSD